MFLVLFREDIFNFFFFDFKNGAQDNLTKDSNNFITLSKSRTYDVRELFQIADDKLFRSADILKKIKYAQTCFF